MVNIPANLPPSHSYGPLGAVPPVIQNDINLIHKELLILEQLKNSDASAAEISSALVLVKQQAVYLANDAYHYHSTNPEIAVLVDHYVLAVQAYAQGIVNDAPDLSTLEKNMQTTESAMEQAQW